ncbi:PIN domain-containing protein [Desulfocastanea catecholica]
MLETKKVFIDTQYFVKAGLHFDNAPLKSFKQHCHDGELENFSTSVVEKEVEAKIRSSVNEALDARKTFMRKARLLSALDDSKIQSLFSEISDEEIHDSALKVFEEYLKDCKTTIVDASKVKAEDLLNLYFNKKPPFGDGKKKSEFPDAISILSLKSQLGADEKIYIVSDDKDLKSFCDSDPQLVSVESLDKLLDIYNIHRDKRVEKVKKFFDTNRSEVEDKITSYLEGCDVYNSSSWEDAEVDDGLSVVSVGKIDPHVVFINDEESSVTFDIDVEFEVTVTGPDFNNGTYDKEDGVIYTFGSTSNTVTILTTYAVEIYLMYKFVDGELKDPQIEDIHISGVTGGIEVSVEENEYDYY